jgi:hypothetical protein
MRGATSGRVGILPPATITDYDITLPGSLAASDKLWQVSSAGVVSLVDPVTIGGTGTELLYRGGASSASAVTGSSWDGTKLQITGNIESTNIHTRTLGSTFLGKNQTGQSLNYVTLIGDGCYAANSASVGEGYATYVAAQSTAIGSQARAEGYASIAIGRSATSNVALTCVFGCGDYPINVIHAGKGITHATPTAWTLKGTGGSGTNVVGGTLYIAPGPSTGNATPSAVVIQSTVPGTSGSTAQTLSDTLTVTGGKVAIGTTDPTVGGTETTSIFSVVGSDGTAIYNAICTNTGIGQAGVVIKRTGTTPQRWVAYIPSGNTSLRFYSAIPGGTVTGDVLTLTGPGLVGVRTTAPDRQVEINSATGDCLRLTYNDSNGSAANYADFAVSSAGNLTVTPSGGLASLVGDFAVASTNYHYWGASTVDGSWRIGRSGNDIVIERRESGVWVTKSTISA